ncbi:MAG: Ribonuclease 1, partial [Pseudomonadota bacterium]
YGWLRPEILLPVHGEIRHMQEQARLGASCGIPTQVVQKNGDLVRIAPGKPGKFGTVRAGRLVLDGDIITPANGPAIIMRRRLAQAGLLVVVVGPGRQAQVEGIGLPLEEDYDAFRDEAVADVLNAIAKLKGDKARDRDTVMEAARLAARRAAHRWSGKRPQVQVMIAE